MKPKYLIAFTSAALIVLALFLLVVLVALSTGDGDPSTEDQLIEGLRPYQEQLDFEIVVPTYLPRGTGRTAEGIVEDGELDVLFRRVDDQPESEAEWADVRLFETTGPHIRTEFGFDVGPAEIELLGQKVIVTSQRHSTKSFPRVGIAFAADLGGVGVYVTMSWQADAGSMLALSLDMEREALEVMESIIENSRDEAGKAS